MSKEELYSHYICRTCGKLVYVKRVGSGTLSCCGQNMDTIGSDEADRIFNDEIMAHPGEYFDKFFGLDRK